MCASQSLAIHEHNYHSTKQEFLVLKWAIAEQFQEYLLWKLFIVKTDNNPLTFIMTTPNLDATQHQWIESLAQFMFSFEYQKPCCLEAEHRNCEVHLGWGCHGTYQKGRCS